MDRRSADRGLSEGRTILAMAVAAVLLATVVVATATGGGGGDDAIDPPHASFVFSTNETGVNVTHYGGDGLDGGTVYLESDARGSLGNVAGTDGAACAANLTRMTPGDSCLVANAATETLRVVWHSDGTRYVLDRRSGDPSPTPTAGPTPTVGPTSPTGPTRTDGPPTTDGTATPPENGTATDGTTPGETPTGGSGTPDGSGTAVGPPSPAPGASTDTPAGESTGTPPGATATEAQSTETESASA